MSDEQQETNELGKELERLFGEFTDALEKDDVKRASVAMNALWVMFQIFASATTTELKELTYLKTPFHFDNGGAYLMTFLHVDGPKIKLREDSGTATTKPFEEIK